jgi:hypothetical protein
MDRRRLVSLVLVLCLYLIAGCPSSPVTQKPHRQGPKVNLSHLLEQPAAYKGRTMSLTLTIDEGIDRSQGQSLRQLTNRDVKFTARGPKGERLVLVIRIPETISIPEAASGDEVVVTFLCSRGELSEGNEAKAIEKR